MDVGLDNPEGNDLNTFTGCRLAEEVLEVGFGGGVDHCSPVARSPGEVDVELQGAHGGCSLQRGVCRAHASAWDMGAGRRPNLLTQFASLAIRAVARSPRSPQS